MTPLASPVFVGRAAELGRLDDALRRAEAGEGAAVIVGGEAGVGKTRLVEELVARADEAGHAVLTGGCVELEGDGLPLAPVVEALRGLARQLGPVGLVGLVGDRRGELARLLPELGRGALPAAGEDAHSSGRLFDLVLGLLEALAAARPVLFVIEDLHWADQSTRALAAFLLRNVRGSRVTLVLTYRADGVGPGHPLRTFLAEAERLRWAAPSGRERTRWVERVELHRFGRVEVAQLVGAILGATVPDSLVDDVLACSDGNAFFVEEVVAASQDGSLGVVITPTLREALLARVDALPAATRPLLRVAGGPGPPRCSPRRPLAFTTAAATPATEPTAAAFGRRAAMYPLK
ncbi:AAA family ATPase, partial [Frankia sp. AgB1.8]|uniref:ATP-binding protein n=1 Tax=Frankia sp. AgB1.8 TaxID=2792839 RepID=UPI001EE43319